MTTPAPSSPKEYSIAARSTDIFGRVLCSTRTHHWIIDGPEQNGCPGEEVTPVEAFLAAVGACGVELVHVIGREQKIPVNTVALTIKGSVDRSRQARTDVTTFTSIRIDFKITGCDGAQSAALVEAFKRR